MKIGMIGLGDIAQKAYLPVLAAQEGIELNLMTRDEAKLNRLGDLYRVPHRFQSLDGLMEAGIEAAFVHASTEAHVEIAKQLLDNGIHVYVDKPIGYHFSEAQDTVKLAERKNKCFMVGFNRRFTPMYQRLKEIQDPKLIVMEKNRLGQPGQARGFVYDDFIHVVDTLRFLLPVPVDEVQVRYREEEGKLFHVLVQLSGGGTTAIGIMNRDSGITEETLEVMGPGEKRVVHNLTEMQVYRSGTERKERSGDWEPTLHRRGFEQIVSAFLTAVENGEDPEPSPKDSLATHKICEQIVEQIEER